MSKYLAALSIDRLPDKTDSTAVDMVAQWCRTQDLRPITFLGPATTLAKSGREREREKNSLRSTPSLFIGIFMLCCLSCFSMLQSLISSFNTARKSQHENTNRMHNLQ